MRQKIAAAALVGLAAAPAAAEAAQLAVNVEIPRLSVAEYHRPYVAIWVEKPDQTAVKTLAVWYEANQREGKGETWLKDMRTWWRKAGRSLDMPMDGVSGPTRAPGKHQLTFTDAQLSGIAPGEYALVVEAAREVGGREVVRVPFTLPAKGAKSASAKGSSELGAVSLTVK
jgi:hypothetical protein